MILLGPGVRVNMQSIGSYMARVIIIENLHVLADPFVLAACWQRYTTGDRAPPAIKVRPRRKFRQWVTEEVEAGQPR